MEVGPLWLLLSYMAVAGFTHLLSMGTRPSRGAANESHGNSSQHNALFVQEAGGNAKPCGFQDFFAKHREGPGIDKWVHYFPIYEEHFGRWCTENGEDKGSLSQLRMAEVGVASGGSMLMWRHAFGEKLKLLVGIDIDNNTKAWEKLGENIKVEIGDQGDARFFQKLKTSYPEGFDIFLDDGSHLPEHQFTTFVHMWSSIRPGGVLMIEDVHGTNPLLKWILEGHKNSEAKMPGVYYPMGRIGSSTDVSRTNGDLLNNWGGPKHMASRIQNEIESIKIYPFVVAITKRQHPMRQLHSKRHGTQWIPYAPQVVREYGQNTSG